MFSHMLYEIASAVPTIPPIPTLAPGAEFEATDAVNQVIDQINASLPQLQESISEIGPAIESAVTGFFHAVMSLTIGAIVGYVLFKILLHVVWGLFSRAISKSRGYEGGFWWGFFLGMFGMLFVALRPDKNLTAAVERLNDTVARLSVGASAETSCTEVVCPGCGSRSGKDAKFCDNCGARLN